MKETMNKQTLMNVFTTTRDRTVAYLRYRVWPVFRLVLGWTLIALGIVGLVLPIFQGIVLIALGVSLVGRRNQRIRWTSVHIKLLIRRLASSRFWFIRKPGKLALQAQQTFSRQRRRTTWYFICRFDPQRCIRDDLSEPPDSPESIESSEISSTSSCASSCDTPDNADEVESTRSETHSDSPNSSKNSSKIVTTVEKTTSLSVSSVSPVQNGTSGEA